MSKELIVSASSQETKAAILEGGEVVEIHIERERDKGIVGSICKGRVTKVLPGMQSAFVNIGLERDAFLYVSDFFEDTDEYDRIVSTAEERVAKLDKGGGSQPPEESAGGGEDLTATRFTDRRLRPRRARRGRLRGKRYEATSSAPSSESGATASVDRAPAPAPAPAPSPAPVSSEPGGLSLLPGESLAKYAAVSDGRSEGRIRERPPGRRPSRVDRCNRDGGFSPQGWKDQTPPQAGSCRRWRRRCLSSSHCSH